MERFSTGIMRGGCKKFVVIESKSFDLNVIGNKEDILKISENGKGMRFSIFLPEPVVLRLLRAWGRFRKSKSLSWCNQMRLHSRIYMLEFKSNHAGKFLQLSVIKEAIELSLFSKPVGMNKAGVESLIR